MFIKKLFIITPPHSAVLGWYIGFTSSVRPACRIRSVTPTVMDGFFPDACENVTENVENFQRICCHLYRNQTLCDSSSEATWISLSCPLHFFCWLQRNEDDITIVAKHVCDLNSPHRWLMNSPHKGPVTRKIRPFDDVIINQTSRQIPWTPVTQLCDRLAVNLVCIYVEIPYSCPLADKVWNVPQPK